MLEEQPQQHSISVPPLIKGMPSLPSLWVVEGGILRRRVGRKRDANANKNSQATCGAPSFIFLGLAVEKGGKDTRNYSNCWKLLQTLEDLGEKVGVSVFICILPGTVGSFFIFSWLDADFL